jgi:hypothetical protein
MEHNSVVSTTVLVTAVVILPSPVNVNAQDMQDHVACDVKWIEAGRPAGYKEFKNSCLRSLQSTRPPAREPENPMSTAAGIRAQADRIFGVWTTPRQQQQKEMWIANRLSEQLDRQRGNSLSIRVNP